MLSLNLKHESILWKVNLRNSTPLVRNLSVFRNDLKSPLILYLSSLTHAISIRNDSQAEYRKGGLNNKLFLFFFEYFG